MNAPPDEFDWIDRLRPLTRGDPRAVGLLDDAAVIPGRAGFDLVVSKDAMVEGVHFLSGESPEVVARRLLRTNLSDLAAKAADPFGYFLMTAWPADRAWNDREAFIRGLRADGETFGLALLGGDTVRIDGPLTVSATVMGWCPRERTVLRSGARAGDRAIVCGVVGDGWLGLRAAKGEVDDPGGRLAAHFRLPEPLLRLRGALLDHARAAADVSDGLVADAGHIAAASGVGLTLDLDRMPLSANGALWLSRQSDKATARISMATGGDDYALICAVDAAGADTFRRRCLEEDVLAVDVGAFETEAGLRLFADGRPVAPTRHGWTH